MDEQKLKELMDEYAEIAYKRDILAMEKKKLVDTVVPLDVKLELDSIDAEFENKEKALDLEEKKKKKEVDAATSAYAQTLFVGKSQIHLTSPLMTLTISEPEVIWNPDALDGYAQDHPELLQFRSLGKNKTRLTRNK